MSDQVEDKETSDTDMRSFEMKHESFRYIFTGHSGEYSGVTCLKPGKWFPCDICALIIRPIALRYYRMTAGQRFFLVLKFFSVFLKNHIT